MDEPSSLVTESICPLNEKEKKFISGGIYLPPHKRKQHQDMKKDGTCTQDGHNSISKDVYLPHHKGNQCLGLSMNALELPSEVIDQKYIQVPQGKVISSDEEWMQCGKWVWFSCDGDLRLLDKLWKDLQVLLEDKRLIMIKSSTKKMKQTAKDARDTIFCYTKYGKKAIKQAADSIRSITQDKYIMFYKDNRRTEAGCDKRFGYVKISTYMHTVLGKFYEKDELERWILVEENEERISESLHSGNADKLSDLQDSSSTCMKNFQQFKLQPPQEVLMAESFNSKEILVFCTMICDCKNKDQNGFTELERVWEAAKELLKRGVFNKIAQGEPYAKFNSVWIACYVPNCSDIKVVTECLKEIRENIIYPHPIFFKEVCNEKGEFQLKYMQTAEGEFYKITEGEAKLWQFIPLEAHSAL